MRRRFTVVSNDSAANEIATVWQNLPQGRRKLLSEAIDAIEVELASRGHEVGVPLADGARVVEIQVAPDEFYNLLFHVSEADCMVRELAFRPSPPRVRS